MKEKVALIIGGSSGIGLAVANKLTDNNEKIVIVARGQEKLNEIEKKLGASCLAGDFSDSTFISSVYKFVEEKYGRLDNLVLSAGYEVPGSLTDLDMSQWEQAVSTNLLGNINVLKTFIPLLKKSESSSVVVIGSVGSERAYKNYAEHYLCKSGLLGFVRSASMDYGKYNVRVNMVSPGWVLTEGSEGFVEHLCNDKSLDVEEVTAQLCKCVPLERMASPEELANVIEFLLSDKSSYITGANIPVDGGLMNTDAGMVGLM